MHKVCSDFMISNPDFGSHHSDHPKWYNHRGFDSQNRVLTIGSSQTMYRPVNYFTIKVDYLVTVHKFWDQFRDFRNDFITKHYPSLNLY